MAVQWDILRQSPDIGASFAKGMEIGRGIVHQRKQDEALSALSQNPSDVGALGVLYQVNPALGQKMEGVLADRAERTRDGQARGALSDWLIARETRPSSPGNALAGMIPAPPDPLAPLPDTSQTTTPTAEASVSDEQEAWERVARADPTGAMKAQLEAMQIDKAQGEQLFQQMDMLARLTRGAVDQPSYERALREAEGLGFDISSMPPQFDPDQVNRFELQALAAKDFLANRRADERAEWDVEDDQIDNQRADRDVSDRIVDRKQRRVLTVRGQDLRDRATRRSQDMTDKRVRSSAGRRARPQSDDGPVAIGPNGQRIVVRNGKWVDARTGVPVQ